ncbi:hypothetical protein BGX30_013254 [Mortierella sp. GBA39]|nr:hypothetical protein BGX30_013254 [Mortierella sp. GBA39]
MPPLIPTDRPIYLVPLSHNEEGNPYVSMQDVYVVLRYPGDILIFKDEYQQSPVLIQGTSSSTGRLSGTRHAASSNQGQQSLQQAGQAQPNVATSPSTASPPAVSPPIATTPTATATGGHDSVTSDSVCGSGHGGSPGPSAPVVEQSQRGSQRDDELRGMVVDLEEWRDESRARDLQRYQTVNQVLTETAYLNQCNQNLQRDNQELQRQLHTLQQDYQALRQDNQAFYQDIYSFRQANQNLVQGNHDLQQENQTIHQNLRDLRNLNQLREQENRDLRNQNVNLRHREGSFVCINCDQCQQGGSGAASAASSCSSSRSINPHGPSSHRRLTHGPPQNPQALPPSGEVNQSHTGGSSAPHQRRHAAMHQYDTVGSASGASDVESSISGTSPTLQLQSVDVFDEDDPTSAAAATLVMVSQGQSRVLGEQGSPAAQRSSSSQSFSPVAARAAEFVENDMDPYSSSTRDCRVHSWVQEIDEGGYIPHAEYEDEEEDEQREGEEVEERKDYELEEGEMEEGETTTPTEVPPSPEEYQQQDQPGQAAIAGTAISSPSPSIPIGQVPIVAPTAQASSSSSTTAAAPTIGSRPSARNPFILSSTRRSHRLTLRNAETPDATVPQSPPATTSSDGDLSTAATVALQSPSLPPPSPPTPTTATTTRSRGRGRVMFEQLMALNSANAIIAAQAAAHLPESEVGSGFGSNVDVSNPSRLTRFSTSGPGTSVTATGQEAQAQAEAGAEVNFGSFSRPRSNDNVVLNLDRGAPTRSLRLRPIRMTGVRAAETGAGIATIVAQNEVRRRARNNAPLGPGAQWLLEAGSAAPSSARRRTRSASAAAAAVNVVASGGAAAGGKSEDVALNLGGNGSTRQQSAQYPRTQRTTRARSTQVNNGGSQRVSQASAPRLPTTLPSTTTTDATAAATSIDDGIAQSAGSTPTPSRGAARAGTKRSRTEMEMPGDNDVPQNAGHTGGAIPGGSSPGAGHSSSEEREDEVMESGVVQLIGRGGETGGVTQTGGEEAAQVEETPQSTQAGPATQVGEPAFDVRLSVHSTTEVTTYAFLLPPDIDPNYPLGYGGVINVPQCASSADTAVGSSTSATSPIGSTSTASSSPSAVLSNSSDATAALSGGIPAARTAVLQAARSMIENLEPIDATLIVPNTTTTTAIVASAGREAAVADDVAPSSGSSTDPVSPCLDDNGGSPSDLNSSSNGSSAGQDGGEGREKRRRVGDRDEDSSIVHNVGLLAASSILWGSVLWMMFSEDGRRFMEQFGPFVWTHLRTLYPGQFQFGAPPPPPPTPPSPPPAPPAM